MVILGGMIGLFYDMSIDVIFSSSVLISFNMHVNIFFFFYLTTLLAPQITLNELEQNHMAQ